MTSMHRGPCVVSLAVVLSCAALAQQGRPCATLVFSGESMSAGLEYTSGSGQLTFKGRSYPFSVSGLGMAEARSAKIEGAGEVFNLAKIGDFSGRYFPVHPGEPVAKNGMSGEIKNEKGVAIRFRASTEAPLIPPEDGLSILVGK